MRQTRTRILSLLLSLMMCLSLLPMTALAADGDVIIDGGSVIGPTDTEYVTSSEVRADTRVAYTVTFDANGGKFADGSTTKDFKTKKVGDENLVDGFPPDPIRDGYEFGGWYRETIGEYPSVFNYDYKKDTTVYAHWEKTNGDTSSLLITFDPNGGTCGVKTLPLVDGILKGPLPVPTRPGFTFEGWYRWYESSANPGRKIAAGEAFTAPETVIAVWSKTELKSVRIDFFANGGRISQLNGKQIPTLTPGQPPYDVDDSGWIDQNSGIGWTNTDATGTLNSLPVAVRDGYTFDGWHKLADDSNFWDVVGSNYFSEVFTNPTGQKLTTSTVNAESATYVAKWVKAEKFFTVTFNLNGATGTAPEPQKVEWGKTVDLPVLTASNANFLGWGYSTDGKTLTEWKAEYTVVTDLTLYARWETESNDILEGMTYRFGNNHSAYGYAQNYKIPLERYQLVFGNNTLAGTLYKQAPAWGGNCFGMSTTSSLFYVDNDIKTTAFNSNAKVPYDLATGNKNSAWNNLTVQQFIEAMQISQSKVRLSSGLAGVISAVESFDRNGPVIIGMTCGKSGHAVVGYAVESESSTQSRLLIYDPNYPNQEKYITLYKNGSGYTGWFYYLGKDANGNDMNWGSSYGNCTIAYLPYASYYQLRNDWAKNISTDNNLLFLNVTSATIKDSNGKDVAAITNGEVSTTRSDVFPMINYGILLDSPANSQTGVAIWLPSDDVYTVTSPASGKLEATLVNVDQSATVTTSASSVTFAVYDDASLNYVQIEGAGADYEITLSSTLGQGHKDVVLSGKIGASGTAVAQISGKLHGTGVANGSTLKVDGSNANISDLSESIPDVDGLISDSSQKPTGTNPFTDVAAGTYYYDAVLWAVQNGVTSGTSATTFSPDASCSRAQIVTFLWRANGSPKPANTNNPFKDVKAGAYYYDAVLWAVEKGITTGTGSDTFSPDAVCTRNQVVTFLWRSAGSPEPASSTNPFKDVPAGEYYTKAVLWAVEKGVTTGTGADTFSPGATCTRGQTVTFLFRSQGK